MAKKRISYLSTLTFDKALWHNWWAKYLLQIRLVVMFILLIIITGTYAYLTIPRRINPEINIAIVFVSTALPGASPEDVEQLVTIPLEDALDNVENVDTMTSSSVEGFSTISLQFETGVKEDKAKDSVQSVIDTVTDLPQEATTPRVQKLDFENEPVWAFAITTKSDISSLMRFSKILKERLENNPKINRATASGLDEQNIQVVINPERIREYNLTLPQVSQAVRVAAGAYPAGKIETTNLSFALSIEKGITTVEDIRNLRITVSGESIRLGEIADVSFISKTNQNQAYLAYPASPPTPAVSFFVYRAKTADIDQAQEEAEKIVNDSIKAYENRFAVTTITNYAQETEEEFSDLAREFTFTMILVFLLLLIFLGLAQAIIASIVVPLTFLSSFAIIYSFGLTLNFLTMFSFLIALGVLIDDAIVVVAAMTRYFATGKFTPAETGVLVWRDFIVPLVSTAITTIWAFVPLLLSTGIIGEFIKTIPIVVTVTMLSSTIIAIFITLPLMIVFLKPQFPKRVVVLFRIIGVVTLFAVLIIFLPKTFLLPLILALLASLLFVIVRTRNEIIEHVAVAIRKNKYTKRLPKLVARISDKGLIDIEILAKRYMVVIDRILVSKHGKRNTLIAIIVFTLVAYVLIPLGLVKNEFFPKQDTNILYIAVELPPGTNMHQSKTEMLAVLERVRSFPQVLYAVGETGQGFSAEMGGRTETASSFLVTMHLTDTKKRSASSFEIASSLRAEFKDYTKGTLTVQELSGGPPAGADVQITILGDDLAKLDVFANRVVGFLQKQAGVTNVTKSSKPGTSKIVFVPDIDALIQHNLTVDQISLWLKTYASGFTLDTIKFGSDEEDIIFRVSNQTQTPENIGRLSVPTKIGTVPLLSLGTLTLMNNPTTITREVGKRTITVLAGVTVGYNTQEISGRLAEFAQSELELEEGYNWKTGGVNEENQRSVNSILQAMVLSFLLILMTMVIEFQSFRQAFIALMFIPLSISGVFYIFALTNTPLSFPALIGVLALFGIVVRHAIVVIEKINNDRKEGMSLRDALVDAAGNRLEPVLLTSLAAIVGLIPITISDPLWRGLGGAIIAGLLFSGIIKLFFVPVTFYLMFKDENKPSKTRSKKSKKSFLTGKKIL